MICQGVCIGCALTVLNTLGTGFLEKVYENALAHGRMPRASLLCSNAVSRRTTMTYWFVNTSRTLLVENVLLVELKVVKALDDTHRMQCANYLKATGLRLCLLLNFWQIAPGDPTCSPRPVNHTGPFACFACI